MVKICRYQIEQSWPYKNHLFEAPAASKLRLEIVD